MYATLQKTIVRSLTLSCALIIVPSLCAHGQESTHSQLRIGLVTPADAALSLDAQSVARGVRLGAAEAKQTATLFGDDVELYQATGSGESGATSAAERLLSARQIQVLIGTSAQDADALSQFAESHHILFLNVASRSPALRTACRRYSFDVEATDAMYANAARIAGAASSSSLVPRVAHAAGSLTDSVVLWGPSLERFGASQLNGRYRDKYRMGMDGSAWAGWAAVKIASEAALRARSTAPAKLVEYLESSTSQFDGHKGWPLSFRRADHQLRQPLYIVTRTASKAVGRAQVLRDVPELRAISAAPTAEGGARDQEQLLDRLLSAPGAGACRWKSR
jgi:ABC-type branched-subunit amino acid transport system substrate-binding protein